MDIQENNLDPVIIEGRLITNRTEGEPADSPVMDSAQPSPLPPEPIPPETQPQEPAETPENGEDGNSSTDIEDELIGEDEFDSLRALTSLLIGGALEGTSQLVSRLKKYEEQLQEEAGDQPPEITNLDEDELDRLRYALFGLVIEAQSTFRRNLSLWARAFDKSVAVTNQVTRPVTNSFLLAPIQRRIDRLAQKGEQSLARWVKEGRKAEPYSRSLARLTYNEIVNEVINQLAENPELQDLVTRQGISLAGEARDEVRERTVTADNLMEGIVRRILRRPPRRELPAPPPEVQRWAKMTLDEYKIESQSDEPNK